MKLHNYGKIPEGYDYSYGEISDLEDEYDRRELEENGIEEAWYWYANGSYEGCGQVLYTKDGKWFSHDCSHCSCYGPLDDIFSDSGYDSLEKLEESCTEDLLTELKPLIAMARGRDEGRTN